MSSIDEAELSALLDGELSPQRSREVKAALTRDPQLRAQFEKLRAMDERWRSAASTAAFQPQVATGGIARWSSGRQFLPDILGAWTLLALGGLLVLRILPKLTGSVLVSTFLHAVGLAIILAFIVWVLSRTDPRNRGSAALQ